MVRKAALSAGGIFCLFLGVIFFIIPGPSLIFFVLGLFLLSFEYPKARKYLRKAQHMLTKSCAWLDQKIMEMKRARY
mgnify:CR=1 FL=1